MSIVGMRRRAATLVLVAGLLSAQAVVPSGSSAQTAGPQTGGRVVVAAEQEPFGGLNHWLVCCSLLWAEWMVDNLLPDAYHRAPDFTFVPEVLSGEAEVTLDPFRVTYRIREEAIWNDSVPVSARDFVFTWRSYIDPRNQIWPRDGYDLITDATVIDDKTVRFEFKRAYPDYRLLFQDVFPRHVLKDKNLNRAWAKKIPISAGPFEFKEYVPGSHLTLARNDRYWGEHLAYLDEVEFRFILKVRRQVQALEASEVDVIYPSLHPRLEVLRSDPDVAVQSSPGLLWEHLDLQFRDRLLRKPFIRRAIAHAVDREQIVEQLIRPIDPDAEVLQSLLVLTNEPAYEAHFDRYNFDPAQSRRILVDHGCEPGADEIFICGGQRLSFVYITTKPNPIRKAVSEVIAAHLSEVGIEVEVRRLDPSVAFGNRILVSGNFDLFNFAWTGPTLEREDRDIWGCSGSQNFLDYCNEDIRALLNEANLEFDAERRANLVNQADEVLAQDIPSLPLYQRPTFLAYKTEIQGLIDNMPEGFTWNLGDWWREV